MLVLPIKKKWFDMIKAGEKLEEYREIKDYYTNRLVPYIGGGTSTAHGGTYGWDPRIKKEIIFRNGYNRESPSLLCLCTLDMGTGKEEWGAEKDKIYYILNISYIQQKVKIQQAHLQLIHYFYISNILFDKLKLKKIKKLSQTTHPTYYYHMSIAKRIQK